MTRTSGTSVTGTWGTGSFWEKRYHDRNVRDELEFRIKLRYLHRNPVERGLVESPAKWKWSSYRHYAMREVGVVEIATEWMAEKDPKGIVECP